MDEMSVLNRLREGVPPQTDLDAERSRLLAEIRGESAPFRPLPVRRAPRLRWGMALAGAVGLAAAVTVAVTGGGNAKAPAGGQPPAAAARVSAAVVLEKAALVAGQTKIVEWRPGQWFYFKETQPDAPPGHRVSESWIRMDGKRGASRGEDGELRVGPGEDGPMNPVKTQRMIESLPAGSGAMLEYFREDPDRMRFGRVICGDLTTPCPKGMERDIEAYAALQWYMEFGPLIPPDKAAAMYQAMARIPNIQIEENATTREGRKGIGVLLDAGPGGKNYTILDPVDFHYLGTKVLTPEGRTVGNSVLASGIVDKPGETP